MYFPVADITVSPFLPPLAAFAVALLTSLGGVSGAFLLLPFQVGVLGYASPSVSATNQVFNVIATPGGIWRYYREGRLYAPLAWTLTLGCVPGVVIGAAIRLRWLADVSRFKFFAAFVLLFLTWRLFGDVLRKEKRSAPGNARPVTLESGSRVTRFLFQDKEYVFQARPVFALSVVIGVIGGVYGVGGGAIIAPFLVSLWKLPVHITAGPTLLCTMITSIGGVLAYTLLAPLYPDISVRPDWLLGALFGVGGLAGMYLGARLQKFLPPKPITLILALICAGTAAAWIASAL